MNQEKIDSFYLATIYEIIIGVSVDELNCVIEDFLEEELYEECAGIKKAIDTAETKTIKELRLEYSELVEIKEKLDNEKSI